MLGEKQDSSYLEDSMLMSGFNFQLQVYQDCNSRGCSLPRDLFVLGRLNADVWFVSRWIFQRNQDLIVMESISLTFQLQVYQDFNSRGFSLLRGLLILGGLNADVWFVSRWIFQRNQVLMIRENISFNFQLQVYQDCNSRGCSLPRDLRTYNRL